MTRGVLVRDRMMRDSASAEIGRRHPYLIRFGPMLAGVAAAFLAVGGLVAFCWWAAAKLSARLDGATWDVAAPSSGLLLVAGVALMAAVACWLLARLLRSPATVSFRWFVEDLWERLTVR